MASLTMRLPKSFGLDGNIKIVSCDSCGCCFSSSRSNGLDYDYYYENNNSYAGNPINNESAMELISGIIAACVDLIGTSGAVCDMGFGSGKLLRAFKNQGLKNLAGIDPSKDSVNALKKEIENVSEGSIYEYKSDFAERFNLITVIDVFEHLYNPREALRVVGKYLRNGGYLLISVPGFDHIDENENDVPDIFNHEHINYFSSVSLDNMMIFSGFEPVVKKELRRTELLAVYRKISSTGVKHDVLKFDGVTAEKIKKYFRSREVMLKNFNEVLSDLWSDGVRSLYLWGVGAFTMYLVANSHIADFELYFVDGNVQKQGMEYLGKIVESPDNIIDDRPIVICAMHSVEAIRKDIGDRRLKNMVVVLGGRGEH